MNNKLSAHLMDSLTRCLELGTYSEDVTKVKLYP